MRLFARFKRSKKKRKPESTVSGKKKTSYAVKHKRSSFYFMEC